MWEIKDKERRLHCLEILLNLVGIGIDYETTMLIDETYGLYNEKGNSITISDIESLKSEHNKLVNEYYKLKKQIDNETNSK